MDLSAVEQAKQRARERALHGKPTRAGKYPSKSSIRSSSGPSNGKHVDHELRDIREAFQATAMRLRLRSSLGKENTYRQRRQDEQRLGGNDLLNPTRSFFFQQRQGSLDLKSIARVDIEKVIKEVDVETIQGFLENITFSEVTEADMRQYTDDAFLKLFRLAQLTLEYLLNVQHTLYTHVAALEKELKSINEEQSLADRKLLQQGEQLKALKADVQQKKSTMKTYELLLAHQAAKQKAEEMIEATSEQPRACERVNAAVNTETKEQLSPEMTLTSIQTQISEAKLAVRAEVEQQQAVLRANDRAFLEETVQELEEKLRQMSSRLEDTERKTQMTLAGSILDDDETTFSQPHESTEKRDVSKMEQTTSAQFETDAENSNGESKDSLMQRLARSKVSPELASARSMQLRRVLRLVRRKIHERSFKQWHLFFVSAKKEIETREQLLMENIKQQELQNAPIASGSSISDPDVDQIMERYRLALQLTPAPSKAKESQKKQSDRQRNETSTAAILSREEALSQVEEELNGLLSEAYSGEEDDDEASEQESSNLVKESSSIVEQASVDVETTEVNEGFAMKNKSEGIEEAAENTTNRASPGGGNSTKEGELVAGAKEQEKTTESKRPKLRPEEVSKQLQEIANAYRRATRDRFSKAVRKHQALTENRDLLRLGVDSGSSRTETTLSSNAGVEATSVENSGFTSAIVESEDDASEF